MENKMKKLEGRGDKKGRLKQQPGGKSLIWPSPLFLRSQMQMKEVCVQRDAVVKIRKLFQLF